MASKKAAVSNKTYILELKNGDTRKITVPGHWKLTYGNVVPYNKNSHNPTESRVALRLYDGTKENLRAVYTDVVSFRDAEIGTLEKRTTVQRKASTKDSPQGARDVIIEARVTEWVNPDNEQPATVPEEFKRLSHIEQED